MSRLRDRSATRIGLEGSGTWYGFDNGKCENGAGAPSRNMVTFNAPVPVAGIAGLRTALLFNGTNQYAQCQTTETGPSIATKLTIAFWAKNPSPSQTNSYVFTYRDNTAGKDNYAIIYGFTANKYEIYSDNTGNSSGIVQRFASPTVTDSLWHHLTIVYDGANFTWYVDGVPQTPSAASFSYNVALTARRLTFGTSNGATNFFNVIIDDFRIYTDPLTAGEVWALSKYPFMPRIQTQFWSGIDALGWLPKAAAAGVSFRRSPDLIAHASRTGSRQAWDRH